jgi:hypothetical protein
MLRQQQILLAIPSGDARIDSSQQHVVAAEAQVGILHALNGSPCQSAAGQQQDSEGKLANHQQAGHFRPAARYAVFTRAQPWQQILSP